MGRREHSYRRGDSVLAQHLTTELTGITPATTRLTWHVDPAARRVWGYRAVTRLDLAELVPRPTAFLARTVNR
jgi:hypothetical protein